MCSTYDGRQPGRDTLREDGYVEDDITIAHPGPWPSGRRLQNTRALLASPGPLESMLKTTTETGDIGVFSIRPSRSSSRLRAPFHPITPSRGSAPARNRTMHTAERSYLRDDRRGLPSYRDTTPEIISMHGSNGQRLMPSSFPRPMDGPRSYSLTSCSSRYMSDQKSTGTWESRSSGGSGGLLAQQRSTHPYHTLLKRPGVRSLSPGLASDGIIDCSRMVDVGTTSYVQKTSHASYRGVSPPTKHQLPLTRPQPGGFQVARSVPDEGEAAVIRRHGSVPPLPRSPWSYTTPNQEESIQSDGCRRLSSAISTVETYESTVHDLLVPRPSISRTGSFYYDYSENYQENPKTVTHIPLSPISTRDSCSDQPMVIDREQPLAARKAIDDPSPRRQTSAVSSSPPTISLALEKGVHDSEYGSRQKDRYSRSGSAGSQRAESFIHAALDAELASPCVQHTQSAERCSEGAAAGKAAAPILNTCVSAPGHPVPSPIDVRNLDDAGLLHDTDLADSFDRNSSLCGSVSRMGDAANVETLLAGTSKVLESEIVNLNTYQCAREPTISTAISRFKTDVISVPRSSMDVTNPNILAPHPVSPAHQLKLRTSVSKLMKELPPLPDGPTTTELESTTDAIAEMRLSKPLSRPALRDPRQAIEQCGSTIVPGTKDTGLGRIAWSGAKMTGILSVRAPEPYAMKMSSGRRGYGSVWNAHFGSGRDGITAVVDRKGDGAIAPTIERGFGAPLRRSDTESSSQAKQPQLIGQKGQFKSSTVRSKPIVRQGSVNLDSISRPRRSSLDTSRGVLLSPATPTKDPIPLEVGSGFAIRGPRASSAVRKPFSDLKTPVMDSRPSSVELSQPDVRIYQDEIIGIAVPVSSTAGSQESSQVTTNSNTTAGVSLTRGLRHRISRWMRSAKKAVKRLGSSTEGRSVNTDF